MITEASLPGGAGKLSQSIDGMGRKTAIHHEAFDEQRTVFDPVGCCLERIIDGTHEVFSYDYLCQLTNDNGRASVYDSLHHRIEHQGETATHNARHQMLSQGGASFRYDRDGRRVADDTYVYSYDACDRLTAIETASSRYEYAYDPFNRRMSSTTSIKENDTWKPVSSERYLWLQDNEIGAVDKDSHLQSLRLLGEGFGGEIGAAVAFEIKGELFIPIHDLSGHVRACITSHGEIAEKLSYTAFGLESRTGQITPWTFSSKRQDEATGFIYFGRRYYDPQTATWLTQDPLGHTAGPNLYAYVKNNPLTCIDLYGLEERLLKDEPNYNGDWACGFSISRDSDYRGARSHIAWETPDEYTVPDPGQFVLGDGEVIEKGKDYPTGLFIFPSGKTFHEKYAGQCMKDMLVPFLPGMNNTKYDACRDAYAIINASKGHIKEVLCFYHHTPLSVLGTLKAVGTVAHMTRDDAQKLLGDYDRFLEKCLDAGISATSDIFSHSLGVAISTYIFGSNDSSSPITIRRRFNFGGAIQPHGQINYVATTDLVPWLDIMNLARAILTGFEDITFVNSFGRSPGDAHSFLGANYQKALRDAMHIREGLDE
jgi:RHS repeat-associated protein